MPLFSLCKWPGCNARVPFGEKYCEKHKARAKEQLASRYHSGKSASSRGYTYRWKKAAKAFLKAHPLCAECSRNGRTTPATCVDHIVPWRGDRKLFWDESNWQPLCAECHSRKTAKEDGGFGNAKRLAEDKGSP